jgi:hypothetical protein
MHKFSSAALRAGVLAATLVAFTAPAFAQAGGGGGGGGGAGGGGGGGANLPQTSGQPGNPNTGTSAPAGKMCPPGSPNAGQAKC